MIHDLCVFRNEAFPKDDAQVKRRRFFTLRSTIFGKTVLVGIASSVITLPAIPKNSTDIRTVELHVIFFDQINAALVSLEKMRITHGSIDPHVLMTFSGDIMLGTLFVPCHESYSYRAS